MTQNGVSVFADREHALRLSREIDGIWYRDDVLWALTEEPESYLDASEYDLNDDGSVKAIQQLEAFL